MKLKKLLFISLLFITNIILAQQITISGVVSDETGSLPGATVLIKGTNKGTETDFDGKYTIHVNRGQTLVFSFVGYEDKEILVEKQSIINAFLTESSSSLEEVNLGYVKKKRTYCAGIPTVSAKDIQKKVRTNNIANMLQGKASGIVITNSSHSPQETDENYASISENSFKKVTTNPLSTFSVDVDAASYSNVRRHLNDNQLPPKDAVRIEEMINYFNYDYKNPEGEQPFSINTELSKAPWNEENLLLHIGLQGKKIETKDLAPSNIVFLLDVSGSMSASNKLPLLKSSLKLLLQTLRPEDRVAIVVYAGSSGVVLPSTSCKKKDKILKALESLDASGSTAGGEGLRLAYKIAEENFIKKGNNRIILATDGDFNVGESSNHAMEKLIEKEREKGIAISVLGFGMGNYKDDKMEIIADKGNGNYAYIDNILEAKKVLVKEFGGTFHTIAKDVKFQLEFNPMFVSKYRLIGYENRLLNDEDFEDDKKDAGEIGSGHTVTALYEIVPNTEKEIKSNLKYQKANLTEEALKSNDLITLKLRYKKPKEDKSILIETTVKNNPIASENTSNNFNFSAAVAEVGMLLRDSEFKKNSTWESAKKLAKKGKGTDEEGYRSEFIKLIEIGEILKNQ
ncbi:vWA domain-containing protein [Aureivirga sp. CE67]|uniref:vWA domain-containing protein n=1 Tax=Aureivirga sp. CE67 TaxID=1788983 RepID=UPI0018CA1868|nr:VWA domain-containing protein [Aureivirga sp. CE67]